MIFRKSNYSKWICTMWITVSQWGYHMIRPWKSLEDSGKKELTEWRIWSSHDYGTSKGEKWGENKDESATDFHVSSLVEKSAEKDRRNWWSWERNETVIGYIVAIEKGWCLLLRKGKISSWNNGKTYPIYYLIYCDILHENWFFGGWNEPNIEQSKSNNFLSIDETHPNKDSPFY